MNLISSILEKRWNDVPLYLDEVIENEDEIEKKVTTPLHLACAMAAPLSIIKKIHQRNPNAAITQNKRYKTPILALLQEKQNFKTKSELQSLLYLIQVCPNSCLLSDKQDNLPLHYILHLPVLNKEYPTIIRELIAANPKSIHFMNDNRETPIQMFFCSWYIPLYKFMKQFTSESSPNDILEMTITKSEVSFKFREIYGLATLFHAQSRFASNSFIQNESCPWLWCEIFYRVNNKKRFRSEYQILLDILSIDQKWHCYYHLFQCHCCKISCSEIFLLESRELFLCFSCFNSIRSVAILAGDPSLLWNVSKLDLGKEMLHFTSLLYCIIRENPYLCSI